MLFHYLHDLLAAIIQPSYRSDRTILLDDDKALVGIIRVLRAIALANGKNSVLRNFVRLYKADLSFCHLLQRMTFEV